ncbi:MAG TPA: hypothetical protein VMY42_15750 [Thermoguttaceae bacterium]|nr:hypothetical protein [Thermoguttaceae bacterium]
MSAQSSPIRYRRLRAPQENHSVVVDPPLDEVGSLVDQNVELRAQYEYDCRGRSLVDLSREARAELLAAARRYTADYCDVGSQPGDPAGLIFLAGHQPQLFHPGVWLKNFVLDHLARRHGAVAVNLSIDSDTVKDTSLRVPGGSVSRPSVEAIPYDRVAPVVPYEQRRIEDRDLFSQFGRRVAARVAPLVPHPLIETYWPLVQQQSRRTDNLGACLAQARHRLETDWGVETLEIPQSRVCDGMPFCWFAADLLAELPRFRAVYNQTVREYRQVHRIRSTAHPVPDLAADDDWLEAPFWVFSTDDPRRRRLFARHRADTVTLSDRHALEIDLPLHAGGDAARAVERLMELQTQGVKIRSRALITTLWARLVLGDLFLHGIGGAKYDQVTDALIERFFGLKPPRFVLFSATLHLPVERQPVNVEQSRALRQDLRRLTYHPERFIDRSSSRTVEIPGDPGELIAAKQSWIRIPQTLQNARRRCRAIRQINESLQCWVRCRREELQRQLARTSRALEADGVLASRRYAFCLYPEETFREFLLQLLHRIA